jgi:hypothetical protein
MNPIWSILHATRGRPEKAVAAMRMWEERAVDPSSIEYIFSIDADDVTGDFRIRSSLELNGLAKRFALAKIIQGENKGSAQAWNEAAKASQGWILIQAQDDVEPPVGWNQALIQRIKESHVDKTSFVVAVSDGYRKDALLCTAICSRERYDQRGEFLCPRFQSVFSDDDFSYAAIRDARDGKCAIIDARDLIFKHEHHYHVADKTKAPWDSTYANQNSDEAYEKGRKLFFERNPEAATDGLRTWA